MSPRNDVEIVNQKIDKARKKISRYFGSNQQISGVIQSSVSNGAAQSMTMNQVS
jgi:hypothetical protein